METVKIIFYNGLSTCVEMETAELDRFMLLLGGGENVFKSEGLYIRLGCVDCAEVLKNL